MNKKAENYGVFKRLSSDNHYVTFTKSVNSAICTEKTLKTIKRITKANVVYGHMGQLVIKDGICYATFLQNIGNDGEEHYSTTSEVVLAIFSLERVQADDFNVDKDIKLHKIGSMGTSCAGYEADSICKDNSMCLIDDKIYIPFCLITKDKITRMFCKIFDITKDSFVEEFAIKTKYKGEEVDFTSEIVNYNYKERKLAQHGYGIIEIVSRWSNYNGEYYATGVCGDDWNNGFLVKTKDFRLIEIVDVLEFNDKGIAEVSSYIYDDKLFVACRQDYAIPYLYINCYDLKTNKWDDKYSIEDGNSRPWFFEYKNELYLANTADEFHRKYVNISKVRTLKTGEPCFDDYYPIETVTTIADMGSYYAICNYNDRLYFISTKDTISFGEIILDLKNPDEINQKLVEIFS